MNRQDRLWKAILEEFFYEFLEYHYAEFAKKVDTTKGFDFLDKDLPNIIPEANETDRKADKVVKVYLKDGTEQWIIVHVEVQGYKDNNFARRMFIYYYRLWEKFGKPIASLVIYSDKNNQNRVNKYEVACLNTSLVYNFDTYVIADYTVEDYEKMDSPIAIIYQVALMGLEKNLTDEQLLEMKVELFRKMYEKGYSKERIRRITRFLKTYVTFAKPEYIRKFEEQAIIITKKRKNMGIIETAKQIEHEDGVELGQKLEHFMSNFENKINLINTFSKEKMPIAHVIKFTKTNKEFINDFQKNLKENYDVILKEIKKRREGFLRYNNVEEVKEDLTKTLLKLSFSQKSISQTLKISPKKVKTIKENLTKK